ncbi:eukaryotic initiation factor 4E [Beauveria bassiana ARSEF 2860]|uniref:Eukaryotic initiation factor 4E n=4 Tax=Beauveria TaxID=5581 RepID=J4UM55_BEAB2|nr:eukaryotic initiation factor 4E [Beauveria bassiana ARSEF 2860]EJP65832.1 eukaryotic initiation factor 4E [Beauveria bassiana ARSEF 2860]
MLDHFCLLQRQYQSKTVMWFVAADYFVAPPATSGATANNFSRSGQVLFKCEQDLASYLPSLISHHLNPHPTALSLTALPGAEPQQHRRRRNEAELLPASAFLVDLCTLLHIATRLSSFRISTPLSTTQHTAIMATAAAEATNMDKQVDLSTIPISPNGKEESDAVDSGKPVTVFHDKDNFNVKHPLQNKWTLWFTKPPSGKSDNWNDLLKEVITFDSVEEFWGVYNNVAPVSELALKSDYHLFKAGVRPEWEDPQNKHGGKWSYQYKDKRNVDVDRLWLQVVMAAIGETLEEEEDGEVMGVVVNVRKAFYRIGVWTRTIGKSIPGRGDGDVAGGKGRSNEKGREILMSVGRRFKEVLELPNSEQVDFSGHTDSAHAGSTRAKAKHVV